MMCAHFKKILLLVLSSGFMCRTFPQTEAIDSLKKILTITKVDTLIISALDDLTWEYLYSDIDSARKYCREAMKKSEEINNERWIAVCQQGQGTIFFQTAEFDSALTYFEMARTTNEKLGLKDRACSNFNGIGNVYLQRGMYKKSLDNYLIAVKLAEETGNKRKSATILNNVALIYHNLSNYSKSLEYHLKSLGIAEELNDSALISSSFTNIANLYKDVDSLEKAEEFHLKSLAITQALNLISRTAQTYNNLALLYKYKGDFEKAHQYLNRGLQLHQQMDNKDGIMAAYVSLGQLYLLEKNYDLSIKYFLDALEKSKKLDVKERIMNIYGNLHSAYSEIQDFDQAYKYLLLYSDIKDSMLNSESSRQIAEMQTIYETEKKQREIELQGAKLEKQDAEINNQKVLNYSFSAGIAMLLILAFLIFRGFQQKKRAHFEIEKRNLKLQRANEESLEQKRIIEEKNKDIIDSIHYAKRIQQAILPPEKFIKQYISEFFILYKPKDIVAGDFYWFHPLDNGQGAYIAAADCTGHGVPGAFVSIVAHNALNRAVKEFELDEPAKILDKVNELVDESFEKSESEIKDGMDIALVRIERNNPSDGSVSLQYAGANNPLWLHNINTGDFSEIKANVQPIGKYINRHQFTNHRFEIENGGAAYLFSDGFADQFGGPKGKKLKYRAFQQLVTAMQQQPMSEQKFLLDKAIEDWKGDLAQIDDICVIGIRL